LLPERQRESLSFFRWLETDEFTNASETNTNKGVSRWEKGGEGLSRRYSETGVLSTFILLMEAKMARTDDLGGGAVLKFLAAWNRHPLSLFVVLVFINFCFMFLLFYNKTDSTNQLPLIISTYAFTLIVLLSILYVLYNKKQVLYNILDVITSVIDNKLYQLRDSLEEIEIGVGDPYEEIIEWISPKTARTIITDRTRDDVRIFEFLTDIQKECGLAETPAEDLATIMLALAKFYYTEGKFERAWQAINNINTNKLKNSRPGEIDFCKGLILKQLHREEESFDYFAKADAAKYPEAGCWKCIKVFDKNHKEKTLKFIQLAENCPIAASTEQCINELSTAYYKMGKLYSNNSEDLKTNLLKAIEAANMAIDKFNSCFAYYNRACDICVMAQNNLIYPDDATQSNETIENMKKQILGDLETAFSARPALAKYSLGEVDLRWLKETYPVDYNQLIGKVYDNNFSVL